MKTVNKTKKEIKYNKVVNVSEDGEITVLDYVFDHKDGFKGATGSNFHAVSIDEYNEKTDKENVIERIIECGVPEMFVRTGAEGCYNAMVNNHEISSFMFDTSYSELWNYLRTELKLSLEQAYIFDCVGGGRCFDKDFQGNINPELSEVIREYES